MDAPVCFVQRAFMAINCQKGHTCCMAGQVMWICQMQDGGVFLVATTRENVSPSLVLELLRRIGGIIKACPAAASALGMPGCIARARGIAALGHMQRGAAFQSTHPMSMRGSLEGTP